MINNPVERLCVLLRRPRMRSGAFVVVSFLATIPFFWLAGLPSPQAGMPGLALEFPGTANTALAILRAFADADLLASVRKAIYWDFALIVVYVIAYASLLEWLPRGEHGSHDELLVHAIQGTLLAGAFDLLEDFGILFLIAQVTTPEHPLFGPAAVLTTLFALYKWTLLVAITGYSAWEIYKRIKRRAKASRSGRRQVSSA